MSCQRSPNSNFLKSDSWKRINTRDTLTKSLYIERGVVSYNVYLHVYSYMLVFIYTHIFRVARWDSDRTGSHRLFLKPCASSRYQDCWFRNCLKQLWRLSSAYTQKYTIGAASTILEHRMSRLDYVWCIDVASPSFLSTFENGDSSMRNRQTTMKAGAGLMRLWEIFEYMCIHIRFSFVPFSVLVPRSWYMNWWQHDTNLCEVWTHVSSCRPDESQP